MGLINLLTARATPEKQRERLLTCYSCPKRKRTWPAPDTCAACGCILGLKVTPEAERCPEGRW